MKRIKVGMRGKVELVRNIGSNAQSAKAGTICFAEKMYGGFKIKTERCSHCGIAVYITKVQERDFIIIEAFK